MPIMPVGERFVVECGQKKRNQSHLQTVFRVERRLFMSFWTARVIHKGLEYRVNHPILNILGWIKTSSARMEGGDLFPLSPLAPRLPIWKLRIYILCRSMGPHYQIEFIILKLLECLYKLFW